MRQEHALGAARRAAGVKQRGVVSVFEAAILGRGMGGDQRFETARIRVGARIDPNHDAQRGEAPPQRLDAWRMGRVDDQRHRTGIHQRIGDFRRTPPGVHRADHGPDPPRGVEGLDHGHRVQGENRDPVVGSDTERAQGGGQPGHAIEQRVVAAACHVVHECRRHGARIPVRVQTLGEIHRRRAPWS